MSFHTFKCKVKFRLIPGMMVLGFPTTKIQENTTFWCRWCPIGTNVLPTTNWWVHDHRPLDVGNNLYWRSAVGTYYSWRCYRRKFFFRGMSAANAPILSETNTDGVSNGISFSSLSFTDSKVDGYLSVGDTDDLYRQKLPLVSIFFFKLCLLRSSHR